MWRYNVLTFARSNPQGGALDADGPFIFTGKLMVDMAGRRLWESFNSITGGGKGETLYLFNEVCLYLAGYRPFHKLPATTVYFQQCQECLTFHARIWCGLRLSQVYQCITVTLDALWVLLISNARS